MYNFNTFIVLQCVNKEIIIICYQIKTGFVDIMHSHSNHATQHIDY